MKKNAQRVFIPIILFALILSACSTAPSDETPVTASPSGTPLSSPISPTQSASSAISAYNAFIIYSFLEQTNTLTGILVNVTARTLTLRSANAGDQNLACSFERIQSHIDELVPGSLITVQYYGQLGGDGGESTAVVTELTVKASPEEARAIRAREILDTMTLSEKVGQLFLAHYPADGVPELTLQFQPGGYILFSRDFQDKTPFDVQTMLEACQQNAAVPMLMGVDEEGGVVNRISKYPQYRAEPFPSPQTLYDSGGWDAIISDTQEKDALLKSLGMNLNLAPVCDVSTDPADFIFKRTFGADAMQTAEYVKTVVETMMKDQMGCMLKHFPGYGNNADTHTGSSIDERPYETFETSDFVPFESGFNAGAGAVMVCHNIVVSMDSSAPASMSAEVHRILREELEFNGVVVTDDVNMQAVLDYAGDQNAAVLAILAGNDMIISPYFDEQIPAVLDAVDDGTITEVRIDESVLRILAWKLRLGIAE